MGVLCFTFCSATLALEVLYVHCFAFYQTLVFLRTLNSKKVQDNEGLQEMLFYWVTFVATSLIEMAFGFIPGVHTLRIIFLSAMLSPHFNLKKAGYKLLFKGQKSIYEGYMLQEPIFEKYLSVVRIQTREFIQKMRKME